MEEMDKKFLNYENNVMVYRTKTALTYGVLYFSKGYQSNPVFAMQFAEVNDPEAEQKTFNWDNETKVWYFTSYDKIFEFYRTLTRWKQGLSRAKENKLTDTDKLSEMFKDFADKNKISNPLKKKSIYISLRYYNDYLLTFTLFISKDNKVSVSIYEDELDMMIKYLSDFITNYHMLSIMHRHMLIARGYGKSTNGGSKEAPQSEKKPKEQPKQDKKSKDAVDELLSGGSLEDMMVGISDDDIPF